MCSLRGKDRPEMSMAFEMPLTTSADPSLLPSNLDISLVLVDVRVSTLVVVMSFATKVLHVISQFSKTTYSYPNNHAPAIRLITWESNETRRSAPSVNGLRGNEGSVVSMALFRIFLRSFDDFGRSTTIF